MDLQDSEPTGTESPGRSTGANSSDLIEVHGETVARHRGSGPNNNALGLPVPEGGGSSRRKHNPTTFEFNVW